MTFLSIEYLEGQVQELEELRLEKQQLQRVIEQQEQQLRKCQQEIGYSQAQLSQLEAVAHHLQSRAGESVAVSVHFTRGGQVK